MNMFDLSRKIAVVTGGSGALGGAIAQGLATAGATVILLGRREIQVNEAADRIQLAGGVAHGMVCDVLDKAQIEMVTQAILNQHGRVDILINAAGGNQPDATTLPGVRTFFDLPPTALQSVIDLNLMGTLLPCQVIGAVMARQKSGVILNISSMAAFTPLTRVVGYAAAKAAINNFTAWLAVYMARECDLAIRVNAIAPGFFVGDQNRALLMEANGDLTARGQQIIDHTPMGRFGNPDDLIGTALWLVSDASRFVTGIVVPIDGGFNAYSGV